MIEIVCDRNLSTGRETKTYAFSIDGFKAFCMMCPTPKGKKIRKYFLDVKKELEKVVPEPKKTQEEVDRLQEENERLRKEKEISSNYQRWRATREDGIAAHRSTMQSLKDIVDSINEAGSPKLYAIVNDAINRAVLDFKEKNTSAFKSSMSYDKSLSVPDVLDDMALRERQAIVERFMRYFTKEGELLRQLPLEAVIRNVYEFADWQRAANIKAGDLKPGHLLSNDEAKERKKKRKVDMKAERIESKTSPPSSVVNNHIVPGKPP